MTFLFPTNGDCINKNDGIEANGGILLEARVCAPADADIYVCGKKAELSGGIWTAPVLISDSQKTHRTPLKSV